MTTTATSHADAATEPAHEPLADRLAILDLTSRLGLFVDARDWDAVAALFTDPIEVDYSSLNGGERETTAPEALVGGWRQVLDRLDATQHLIAGHVIEIHGDSASCSASVQGTHALANRTGGAIWTVGGRYDFGLIRTPAGWRIRALTLTVQWATGNQHVMELASAAATSDA